MNNKTTSLSPIKLILGILFIVIAGLQYNDPDPLLWATLYIFAGLAALGGAIGKLPRFFAATIAVLSLIWAASLLGGILTAASYSGTEIEREFIGLLLVALAMGYLERTRQCKRCE